MPRKTSELTNSARVFVFGALLLGAIIGLVASTVLSYEAIVIARDSEKVLSCDLSAVVSCGTVARHWSSHIVGDIPNSFVGMVAFPVFITIAVAGLARTKFPRWFMRSAEAGAWISLLFAGWMFYMSYHAIGALCPWCLTTDVGVLIVLFALLHYGALTGDVLISPLASKLKSASEQGYDLAAFIGVAVLVAVLILVKFGANLF